MVGKLGEKEIEQESKRESTLQHQSCSCAHLGRWLYFYTVWFALIAMALAMSFLWGLAPLSTKWNKHNPVSHCHSLVFQSNESCLTCDRSHCKEKWWESQANASLWFGYFASVSRSWMKYSEWYQSTIWFMMQPRCIITLCSFIWPDKL